jgi:DNA-binding CsgD family transcriptional regulator
LVKCLDLQQQSGERYAMGRTFDRLANLAATCADPDRALKLMGAADAVYAELAAQRTPQAQQTLDLWFGPVRAQQGEASTDRAVAEGRALGLDAAVAFALGAGESADAHQPVAGRDRRDPSPLTAREQEVAVLLARGLSNRQIARELVISLHTAQRHVENILGKLALSSRTQVAAWAISRGLA